MAYRAKGEAHRARRRLIEAKGWLISLAHSFIELAQRPIDREEGLLWSKRSSETHPSTLVGFSVESLVGESKPAAAHATKSEMRSPGRARALSPRPLVVETESAE